jgi:ABC-type glycerol-3-phosphate transport system substrate-binding protein
VKVPTTLDELEAAAKALHGKPMTDDGQPGFGIVARGKRAAATSVFSGYLHAMGATWIGPNREPVFNSEEGIKSIFPLDFSPGRRWRYSSSKRSR